MVTNTPGWSIILPEGLLATPGNILTFMVWVLAIFEPKLAETRALVAAERCAQHVRTFSKPREPEIPPKSGPKWPKTKP